MALSVTVHGFTIKTGTQTTGRLATADITIPDGLDQVIYTVPSSPDMRYAILAISVCNRLATSVDNLNIAIADSDLSKPVDFIEWKTVVVPKGVLERTQLSVQPGQRVILRWGDRPTELVPDHEINDYAGNWTGAVTGTGTINSTTPGQVSLALNEGDTGTLNTGTFALVEGNTYRATVSFYSTDVTGTTSSTVLRAQPGDIDLITLSAPQRDDDSYQTYSLDFTVDNATDFSDQITQLQVAAADVDLTLDRISLIQIS